MEWRNPVAAQNEVYYDDLILPAKLCVEIEEAWSRPGRFFLKPSARRTCCESCGSGSPSASAGGTTAEDTVLKRSGAQKRITYTCPHCGVDFLLSIALKQHLKAKHGTDKSYRCSECSFGADELPVLRRHLREVHCLEKRHHCPHCKYKAKRSTHLRRHVEARHAVDSPVCRGSGGGLPALKAAPAERGPTLPCDRCDFTTTTQRSLERHSRRAHGARAGRSPAVCPQCGEEAPSARRLRHHVRTAHENAKAYDCPLCPYSTVHLGSLKNHVMARHTGERGHVCPHCPYSAVQSGNLRRHLATKHPARPVRKGRKR